MSVAAEDDENGSTTPLRETQKKEIVLQKQRKQIGYIYYVKYFVPITLYAIFWPFFKMFSNNASAVQQGSLFTINMLLIGINLFPATIQAYSVMTYFGGTLIDLYFYVYSPEAMSLMDIIDIDPGRNVKKENSETERNFKAFGRVPFILYTLTLNASAILGVGMIFYIIEDGFEWNFTLFVMAGTVIYLICIGFYNSNVIRQAWKGHYLAITEISKLMDQDSFILIEEKAVYDTLASMKSTSKKEKIFRTEYKILEFSQTFAMLYLLVLYILKFIVDIQGVTAWLDSGTSIFNQIYYNNNQAYSTLILVFLVEGILLLLLKISDSAKQNSLCQKILNSLNERLRILNMMVCFSDQFKGTKEGLILMSRIDEVLDDDIDLSGVDSLTNEKFLKELGEHENPTSQQLHKMNDFINEIGGGKIDKEQLLIRIERLRFFMKEFTDFVEDSEYKFLGCFTVNSGLLKKMIASALASIAGIVFTYLKNHLQNSENSEGGI